MRGRCQISSDGDRQAHYRGNNPHSGTGVSGSKLAQVAEDCRWDYGSGMATFPLQACPRSRQPDDGRLGPTLMPAAPKEVTERDAVPTDVMVDGSVGYVDDCGAGPASRKPDGQFGFLTTSRFAGSPADLGVEASDPERLRSTHAHVGTDRVAHDADLFREAAVAAANDPVELRWHPARPACQPQWIDAAAGGHYVRVLVGSD